LKKVIDIEERVPAMRERRRRKTNRKFIFILAVFVIALLLILYFQSPLSRINKVIVKGSLLHDEQFYIDESGLNTDSSLWGFSTNDISKELQQVEGVQNVKVNRKWMQDVLIDIQEWKTVAYIEERGQYSLLLANGEIFFAEELVLNEEVPILNGFTDVEVRKQLTAELKKMDKDVYPLISEIIWRGTKKDPDNITVFMDDGFEVRAILSTFAGKMDFYPEIIAQLQGFEKGIIDMEVGTFFTPFSELYNPNEEDVEIVGEDE